MSRIMPEPRYFSIPSTVVGGVAFRNAARNCRPWVRSLTQVPLICTPLAGGDAGGMADNGDQVPLPARLHAQHAEAALLVVVRHALDQTGQRFSGSGVSNLRVRRARHQL